ncbi:MAG TPA: DUF1674 domain-containing protein [Methylocystis sp.]|nr:DUF1674 domain-containing protein [Methylocystis sp.]
MSRENEAFAKASSNAEARGAAALTPPARRALKEAEQRRRAAAAPAPREEVGGPDGPEPTRYGDWERKGIASDF